MLLVPTLVQVDAVPNLSILYRYIFTVLCNAAGSLYSRQKEGRRCHLLVAIKYGIFGYRDPSADAAKHALGPVLALRNAAGMLETKKGEDDAIF
jgi:hypothetical protein